MHKVHFDKIKSPVLDNIWSVLKDREYSPWSFSTEVAKDDKFIEIGSGSYAHVFEHTDLPGMAIRVGSTSGYSVGDHKKYVDLARRSTSLLVPKYYYMASKTELENDSYDSWETTVTVMERLEDIDNADDSYETSYFIDDNDYVMERYFSGSTNINTHREMRRVRKRLGWNTRSAYNLRRQVIRSGLSFNDMHSGNILARKTPRGYQFVITDPVA